MKTTAARVAATLGLLGVAAAACKDDPQSVAEAGGAGAPTAVASGAAAASAVASAPDSDSAAAAASGAPAGEAPHTKGGDAGMEMHVAYAFEMHWGSVEVGLYDLGRLVVMPHFLTLEGDKFVGQPEDQHFDTYDFPGTMLDGSVGGANWIDATMVVGKWPTELWVKGEATFGIVAPRSGYARAVYTWQRQYGRWGRVADEVVGAMPWGKTTLAYAQGKGFLVGPGSKAKMPQQMKGEACAARVSGRALATDAGGGVWLLGSDCDDGGRFALERWNGGTDEALVASRRVALPGAPAAKPLSSAWILPRGEVAYALVTSDKDQAAWLLRGETVQRLELPAPKLKSAHAAADGTLFIVASDKLYRYDGQGQGGGASKWSQVKTPESRYFEVGIGVYAASKDRVYLPARVGPYQGFVLSSKAVAGGDAPMLEALAVFEEEGRKAAAAPPASELSAAEAMAAFPELDEPCKTPFVVFFPVAGGVPRDFAFPQTQSQLKGFAGKAKIAVVDFVWQGRRFVGATVPDTATASAVMVHWNARDKKSPSRTACHVAPESARAVVIP